MADTDAPPAQTLPSLAGAVDVYEELLELAEEHLHRPLSAKIDTWEDGTYRVQVYHHVPPDAREVLYYHSEQGVIRYGVEDGDELLEEREIKRIEPGEGSPQDA